MIPVLQAELCVFTSLCFFTACMQHVADSNLVEYTVASASIKCSSDRSRNACSYSQWMYLYNYVMQTKLFGFVQFSWVHCHFQSRHLSHNVQIEESHPDNILPHPLGEELYNQSELSSLLNTPQHLQYSGQILPLKQKELLTTSGWKLLYQNICYVSKYHTDVGSQSEWK